jgi:hypothetical protein
LLSGIPINLPEVSMLFNLPLFEFRITNHSLWIPNLTPNSPSPPRTLVCATASRGRVCRPRAPPPPPPPATPTRSAASHADQVCRPARRRRSRAAAGPACHRDSPCHGRLQRGRVASISIQVGIQVHITQTICYYLARKICHYKILWACEHTRGKLQI